MAADMQARQHVFYRNEIRNNGKSSGISSFWATDLYYIDNIFQDNGDSNQNTWSINSSCPGGASVLLPATQFVCPGNTTIDATNAIKDSISTNTFLTSGDSRCDLANVNTIFE